MTRKNLANSLRIDIKTLKNWEENRPEVVRLINLGLKADSYIKETKKLLEKIVEIEKNVGNNKFNIECQTTFDK